MTETPSASPYGPQPNGTNPLVAKRVDKVRKDYWGPLILLYSFLALGGAIIVASSIAVIPALVNAFATDPAGATSDPNGLTADLLSNPWVIVASTVPMYIVWVFFAFWVSKYRSGVGVKFKNTWEAFKTNFWLTKVKWYDVFIGLGVAIGFVALQAFVLNFLPSLLPGFEPESTDNTKIFANLNGLAFFLIGFGIVGFLGPIMEELFFRGFLLRGLLNRFELTRKNRLSDVVGAKYDPEIHKGTVDSSGFSEWLYKHKNVISITITSLIFGSFHIQGPGLGSVVIVLITGSLGFVLGTLTLKLQRSAPSMFAHAFHNSIAIGFIAVEKYFSGN